MNAVDWHLGRQRDGCERHRERGESDREAREERGVEQASLGPAQLLGGVLADPLVDVERVGTGRLPLRVLPLSHDEHDTAPTAARPAAGLLCAPCR